MNGGTAYEARLARQTSGRGLSNWFPNPNSTRYFFTPSAFNLKKGEGYYQNTYALVNLFNYGVTDWFSIGGGFEFLTTITTILHGNWNPYWAITPKIGFQVSKNWHLGLGFMGGTHFVSIESTKKILGQSVLYGLATYGNRDNNLTFGVGLPMITKGTFIRSPVILVNGMLRISQKLSLMSENWISTGDDFIGAFNALTSYGIRWFGEKISVDLGFVNSRYIAQLIFIGIPYIDFAIKFNKR